MPIRVEHSVSGGTAGVAGWRAGRSAARGRTRKYALDLYRDQQQIQARRADRIFQAQVAMGLQKQRQEFEVGRDEAEREFVEERDEARFDYYRERDEAEGTRRYHESIATGLSPIPDYVDAETRKILSDKARAIREALLSRRFEPSDPKVKAVIDEEIAAYENIISKQKPPSAAEMLNRDLVYVDEATGVSYDKPGEGLVPYRGDQPAIDRSAEREEQEKEAEQQQNMRDERTKRKEKLQDKLDDNLLSDRGDEGLSEAQKTRVKAIQDEIDSLTVAEQMEDPEVIADVTARTQKAFGRDPTRAETEGFLRYKLQTEKGEPDDTPELSPGELQEQQAIFDQKWKQLPAGQALRDPEGQWHVKGSSEKQLTAGADNDTLQRAITAAKSGNKEAQEALEKRGIPWQ